MILGIGVDVCAVGRLSRALGRPAFAPRVFTPAELDAASGTDEVRAASLAGRFAVKEALAKAIGAPPGLAWTDCEVTTDATGRPRVRCAGGVQARLDTLGVRSVHVSISHDAGVAVGMVVCEG